MRCGHRTRRRKLARGCVLAFGACTFVAIVLGDYAQQGGLLIGTGAIGARQGAAIALAASGGVLAIGAPFAEDVDSNAVGAAWVFTRSNTTVWTQLGPKIVGAMAEGNALQGYLGGVALSGDGSTLAVAGPWDNFYIGAVWVFSLSASGWSPQGPKLVGSGWGGGSNQQISVALSGDGSLLAAGNTALGGGIGGVSIFERVGGMWRQQGDLVGEGWQGESLQGAGVSLSKDGKTLALGGPGDFAGTGAVWVFTRGGAGQNWTQLGSKLVGDGADGYAAQGTSVALSSSGRTLAIGGPKDSSSTGATWVLSLSSTGEWTQMGPKLVGNSSEGETGSYQGSAVSLSANGSTLAVGGDSVGSTFVFEQLNGAWVQQGDTLQGVDASGSSLSAGPVAISGDGSVVAVGGQYAVSGGAAWMFEISSQTGSSTTGSSGPPPEAGAPPPPPDGSTKSAIRTIVIVGGVIVVLLIISGCWKIYRGCRRRAAARAKHAEAQLPVPPSWLPLPPSVTKTGPSGPDCRVTVSLPPSQASCAHTASTAASSLVTFSTTASAESLVTHIPAGASAIEALQAQLDYMHARNVPLCRRFSLGDRSERRVGGQGVVQFAQHRQDPRRHFACKFYLDAASYETEARHYSNPRLHHILPAIEEVTDNRAVLVLGRPLPPMVVMEKGESLDEWQRRCPGDFTSALNIMIHLARRVHTMHGEGVAHRDLKPANSIYYPGRNEWLVIDFGGAAMIGERATVTCTLAYAAPEVVLALACREKTIVVDPACDVWSLGIMAWELLTRTRVFPAASADLVEQTMMGEAPLPWEDTADPALRTNLRMLGFMREGVLSMLKRDPRERAALDDVVRAWHVCLERDTTYRTNA